MADPRKASASSATEKEKGNGGHLMAPAISSGTYTLWPPIPGSLCLFLFAGNWALRAGHKVLFFSLFTWSRTHRKKKGNNCPGSYVKRKKRKELAVETPTFGWNHINFLFLSIHNVGATASHWPERWNCATNVCDLVASFYLSLGQWASDSEQVVTRVRGVGRKHVADHFSYFLFLWPAPKLLYAGQ